MKKGPATKRPKTANELILDAAFGHLKARRPKEALVELNKLRSTKKTHSERINYHVGMARYYEHNGMYSEAIAEYQKIEKDNSDARHHIVSLHNQLEDYSAAAKALAENNHWQLNEALCLRVGAAYNRAKEYDNQIVTYITFIAINNSETIKYELLRLDKTPIQHQKVGDFFARRKEWQNAIKAFKKAGNFRSQLLCTFNLPKEEFHWETREEVIDSICEEIARQSAKKIENGDALAALNQLNDLEAILIERKCKFPFLLLKMACFESLGQPTEAIAYAEKFQNPQNSHFYSSIPKKSEVSASIARCYETFGDFTKALAMFQILEKPMDQIRILTKTKKTEQAKKMLEELRYYSDKYEANAIINKFKNFEFVPPVSPPAKAASSEPVPSVESLASRMASLDVSSASLAASSNDASSSQAVAPLTFSAGAARKAQEAPKAPSRLNVDADDFITPKKGRRR